MKYKILIVDDEPANLRLLERLFRRLYEVIIANSGEEALSLIELHDIALIISDQRMPGMTGIEFLKRASEIRPKTVRIILTGYTDINDLVDAVNSGVVYKYITKPWDNEDLQLTVVRGLEHFEVHKDRHDLAAENARLNMELAATNDGFINLISEALRARDASIPEKCARIAEHAAALGHWLELEEGHIEQLSVAAKLCEIERFADDQVEMRSTLWASLLEDIPGMEEVASAIRFQHSHFDGNGLPENLLGEQLPLFARILSIANAYDSWVFPTNGQEVFTQEEAFEKLRSGAGTRFDPKLVDAFCVVSAIGSIHPVVAGDRADDHSLRA